MEFGIVVNVVKRMEYNVGGMKMTCRIDTTGYFWKLKLWWLNFRVKHKWALSLWMWSYRTRYKLTFEKDYKVYSKDRLKFWKKKKEVGLWC